MITKLNGNISILQSLWVQKYSRQMSKLSGYSNKISEKCPLDPTVVILDIGMHILY